MSEYCSTCGVTTRGGACSKIDSRRQRDLEEARCPNNDREGREYARQAVLRALGLEP